MQYRRDIDGLRAVSILLILGFHAFPERIPGGFVGVDVFFVISGFLISSIILRRLEKGEFSFLDFYAHRIRRIFPALIIVLLACFVIGLFVLFADEYKLLGKHILGAAGFASNFILKSEAGYFDKAADMKPLLHLWSLGVEEQFYVLWPLILVLAWRARIPLIYCIAIIGAVSFGLNLGRISSFPAEAFFLPHTRIWELLAGGGLGYWNLHKPSRKVRAVVAELTAALGTVAILVAGALLDRSSKFPGYWALLPVIGACLLIWAGEKARFNRVVLGSRLLVGIGLISYPLYLWHWPLFSFARIIENGAPAKTTIVLVALISLLLAWLTFVFIERPIRRSNHAPILFLLLIALGGLGFYIFQRQGQLTERLKRAAAAAESLKYGKISEGFVSDRRCPLPEAERVLWCAADTREAPRYLLLGDSQAPALFSGLVATSRAGERWAYAALPGFKFLDGVTWQDRHFDVAYQNALRTLINSDMKLVLVIHNLRNLKNLNLQARSDIKSAPASDLEGFSELTRRFERAGKVVVFTIPTPWIPAEPENCFIPRPVRLGGVPTQCFITLEQHEASIADVRKMYADLKKRHPQLKVYDPTPVLCPNRKCSVVIDGKPVFGSADHLSDYGSELVARDFLNWLQPLTQVLPSSRPAQSGSGSF